jgi:hypothetical protein
VTQRTYSSISWNQFQGVLARAWNQGHVESVLVDHHTNYIHYYQEGVLLVSTKWDYYAQISNNWLAKYPLPQDTQ